MGSALFQLAVHREGRAGNLSAKRSCPALLLTERPPRALGAEWGPQRAPRELTAGSGEGGGAWQCDEFNIKAVIKVRGGAGGNHEFRSMMEVTSEFCQLAKGLLGQSIFYTRDSVTEIQTALAWLGTPNTQTSASWTEC